MRTLDRGNFALGFLLGFFLSGALILSLKWIGVAAFSADDVIAFASVIVALAALFVTYLQFHRSIHQYDSEFIFNSERDYGLLFENLKDVGDWIKRPDNKRILDEISTDTVARNIVVFSTNRFPPDDIWTKARPIKSHFKSIALLYSEGIISKRVARVSLRNAGFELLIEYIWKMDIGSFYYTWRNEPSKINDIQLTEVHAWYRILQDLMRSEGA